MDKNNEVCCSGTFPIKLHSKEKCFHFIYMCQTSMKKNALVYITTEQNVQFINRI